MTAGCSPRTTLDPQLARRRLPLPCHARRPERGCRKGRGRDDHVQRYTAFAGHAFEFYCLRLAKDNVPQPAIVLGEQAYGRGAGKKTSDVAIAFGDDLILLEANSRRVSAVPLVTGDPQDATPELTKLLVKKVNQLGVSIGALLAESDATRCRHRPRHASSLSWWRPGPSGTQVICGNTSTRPATRRSRLFADERVQPLQVADAAAYEALIGLARDGHSLPEILEHKTDGAWRHRDWAVWLKEDDRVPGRPERLPSILATFEALTTAAEQKWFPHGQPPDHRPPSAAQAGSLA